MYESVVLSAAGITERPSGLGQGQVQPGQDGPGRGEENQRCDSSGESTLTQ